MDCVRDRIEEREEREQAEGRRSPFFFVLFLSRETRTRRRTKRLAIIVERKSRDVNRERTAGRLHVDDNGDRTAFDAVAKGKTATAGEARVCEPLQHVGRSYYRSALISRSNCSFVAGPMCFRQIVPSRAMKNVIGTP